MECCGMIVSGVRDCRWFIMVMSGLSQWLVLDG